MKTFTKIALALSLAFAIPAYADEYVDTKFDSLVGSSGSRVNGDRAVMFRSQLNF
jgi:hypothetical protein